MLIKYLRCPFYSKFLDRPLPKNTENLRETKIVLPLAIIHINYNSIAFSPSPVCCVSRNRMLGDADYKLNSHLTLQIGTNKNSDELTLLHNYCHLGIFSVYLHPQNLKFEITHRPLGAYTYSWLRRSKPTASLWRPPIPRYVQLCTPYIPLYIGEVIRTEAIRLDIMLHTKCLIPI